MKEVEEHQGNNNGNESRPRENKVPVMVRLVDKRGDVGGPSWFGCRGGKWRSWAERGKKDLAMS